MIRRPPRSTLSSSSAASDVYKRQQLCCYTDGGKSCGLRRSRIRSGRGTGRRHSDRWPSTDTGASQSNTRPHLRQSTSTSHRRILCTVISIFKLAVTVRQCLNGRAPPYLSEHCIPVSSADTRRHLRSANRHQLALPRFPLNTYGRRAFSVAGPIVWNSLPDFIQDPTSSTDCFRRLLKTYLFARY